MTPTFWRTLVLFAVPAIVAAGLAEWYADGVGPDWLDTVVVAGIILLGAGALYFAGVQADDRQRKGLDERADRTPQPAPAAKKAKPTPPPPKRPEGEDALVLLATLQREARLIDFLKEDLSAYDDAQVGAAVRDVHRDAAATLERLFAPVPAVDAEEGSRVDPASLPAARVKTTGKVGGGAGTLVHPGWAATKVNLPARTGPPDEDAVRVLAPAEVEVA